MSQQRVAVRCPACSPGAETPHEVLTEGGRATVRCGQCGHVHKTTVADESTIDRRVVVSQDGESTEARIDLPPDEPLETGQEFLVETDAAILSARITSLELVDGGRTDAAPAREVRTVWARAVGNVAVRLTLHPADGGHDESRSVKIQVPGDERFVVGETRSYGEEEFTVERLLIREDATDYGREGYDHDGDAALAKDLKRVYARDEASSTRAWSGW